MNDDEKDFTEILEIIKNNSELLEVFNDQTYIWWNKKDVIKIVKHMISKYIHKKSSTYDIVIQFKMSLKSLIDKPKDLLELIDSCLKPKQIEKKKFGEVFTPMELVNKILDKLPHKVWFNTDLKWFDPANGMGNFPIAVYLRLIKTLEEAIPDYNKRKKHILENMLYMAELNKKNIYICKQIFDINNEYNLNLHHGDFMELDVVDRWGIKYFDVVMGNPPYQKENKKNNKARGGTNNNLYIDFINKSLKLLKKNGYLIFINPQAWRKINSKTLNAILKEYSFVSLNLNMGGDYFSNVSVKVDYYTIINNINYNLPVVVECNYDKKIYKSQIININRSMSFIPNLFNSHINSILKKICKYGESYKCIISSDCHKTRKHVKKGKDKIFKYPLFNTSGNPFGHFSSKPHKNQYDKKVILSNSGKLKPFYDNGMYGTTQDSMYIMVSKKKYGDKIVKILNSDLYKLVVKICKWSNFRNDAKLFSYLKYPIKIKQITNDNIHHFLQLSNDEINFIQSVI